VLPRVTHFTEEAVYSEQYEFLFVVYDIPDNNYNNTQHFKLT